MGYEVVDPREKERLILELAARGKTYREICRELRVSPSKVSEVLKRAREREAHAFEVDVMVRLAQMDGYLQELAERVEALERRVAEVEGRITELDGRVSEVLEVLTERRVRLLEGLDWWDRRIERRIRMLRAMLDDVVDSLVGCGVRILWVRARREEERIKKEEEERKCAGRRASGSGV